MGLSEAKISFFIPVCIHLGDSVMSTKIGINERKKYL